jgi:acyl-CoA thioester hydrolase
MTPTPEPAFTHPVRVYWEDTDAGGVVFYANYLKFFERARTEWLRAHGFSQQQIADETDVVFVVTQTDTRYHRPARLDDALTVTVEPREIGRVRMAVYQRAMRGPELLCEGTIHLTCVQRGTFRPCRVPKAIIERLTQPLTPEMNSTAVRP